MGISDSTRKRINETVERAEKKLDQVYNAKRKGTRFKRTKEELRYLNEHTWLPHPRSKHKTID